MRKRTPNALFAASLAFAFAIVSICLHDALIAFVSAGHGGHSDKTPGSWLPLCSSSPGPSGRSRLPLPGSAQGAAGLRSLSASPPSPPRLSPNGYFMAGWFVDQRCRSVLGNSRPWISPEYPRKSRSRRKTCFSRQRRLARDSPSHAIGNKSLTLPAVSTLRCPSFWVDVRFYIGWALGLLLAPEVDFDPLKKRSSAPEFEPLT